MLEDYRRRTLRQLNSKYIYGKYPLLHILVFAAELTMISLVARRFNAYYANRPVLTTMITNAILGGIADTVAQTLTAINRAPHRKSSVSRSDLRDIELDRKTPWPEEDSLPPVAGSYRRLPSAFDFERLTRFMSYGFMMAPVQHTWFAFLSATFPVTETAATSPAMKRVALDQLLFAPVGLACFFTFMTVTEGGSARDVRRKFEDVYVPALKANFMVWPAVQMLNFRIIPMQFQIPFVSTIGVAWTAYLSLTNQAAEP